MKLKIRGMTSLTLLCRMAMSLFHRMASPLLRKTLLLLHIISIEVNKDDFEKCPYHSDDKLLKVAFVKPTSAHYNYDVGDTIEVMFSPIQKVLILEKITCEDVCEFIGYSFV